MNYHKKSIVARDKYKYKEGDLVKIPNPSLLEENSGCIYGQSESQIRELIFKILDIKEKTCTLRAVDPKTKEELPINSNNILYHHLKKIPTVEIKI